MKSTLLITLVCTAAVTLSGCMSFSYEERYSRRRPCLVHAPVVKVVDVVPAPPGRPHRSGPHRRHRR